jgi:hypothetical protein
MCCAAYTSDFVGLDLPVASCIAVSGIGGEVRADSAYLLTRAP